MNYSGAFFLAIVSCCLIACSSNSALPAGLQNVGNGSPPPAGGDMNAGTDGGVSTGGDASIVMPTPTATCDAPDLLTTGGLCPQAKAAAAPEPLGGTVLSGTYVLTAINVYGTTDAGSGSDVCQVRYEIVISGSALALTYELTEEALVQNASGMFTTNGNALIEALTCQAFQGSAVTPATAYAAYTAAAGELRLYGAPFSPSPTSLVLSTEYVFTQE